MDATKKKAILQQFPLLQNKLIFSAGVQLPLAPLRIYYAYWHFLLQQN